MQKTEVVGILSVVQSNSKLMNYVKEPTTKTEVFLGRISDELLNQFGMQLTRKKKLKINKN